VTESEFWHPSGPHANASSTLLRLSQIAGGSEGWESAPKGTYIYTRTVGESPSCDDSGCVLVRFTRESWVARDGSGRIVESRGGEHSDRTFGAGELPFEDFMSMLGPGFADQLRSYVEEHMATNQPHDFAMFGEICTLLGETQAVPEARLVLFRLAATLPDTELLGPMTDELGRAGIGVGYTANGIRHEVIFSRDSALVLEERGVQVAPADGSTPSTGAASDGVAGSWTAYYSGPVDSLGGIPYWNGIAWETVPSPSP